jgi:hypothetical protein
MKVFWYLPILLISLSCSQFEAQRDPASASDKSSYPFSFWPYEFEGCQNTKDQFLEKNSFIKVTYSKKLNQNCHVETGRWRDFFTGEIITNASEIRVTSVIPLAHLKRKSLNKMPTPRVHGMMKDQDYLIILKSGGIGESLYLNNDITLTTLPANQPSQCEYIGMWNQMKERWSISTKKFEQNKIEEISNECEKAQSYERDYFKHWSTLPGFNCNTRYESLRRDSQVPLTFLEKENTKKSNPTCPQILSGQWYDLYTGDIISDPKVIDIDHFVPLQHAYMSGGWSWPQWKKEDYANSLKDPMHLVSVSASQNRKKGAKDPSKYIPPLESYHCDYVEQWLHIKWRWNMKVFKDEETFIRNLSQKCSPEINEKLNSILDFLKK